MVDCLMAAVDEDRQATDADPGLLPGFLTRDQHILVAGRPALQAFGSVLIVHDYVSFQESTGKWSPAR
jgi:hypothetical protein